MAEKAYIPLVFIGGCPRSGTTLMKRTLDAYTQIYCGPEFGHVPAICDLYKNMKQGIVSGRLEPYSDVESLREYICDFMLKFFEPAMAQNNAQLFAEKTPDNVMHFCTLHELFPQAKFIHVIRNPLDVVAFYMRVGERLSERENSKSIIKSQIGFIEDILDLIKSVFPVRWRKENHQDQDSVFNSPLLAAQHWKKQVFFPRRFKDVFSSNEFQDNYFEVKYEDIVTNSEGTVRKICDFIGVEFEIEMLALDRALNGDAVSFGGIFYNKQEYVQGITDTSIGRWEKSLTREAVCTILREVRHDLVRYGYMTNQEVEEILNAKF
jgi:hypothetical protein